jgi:hypothetical protein
VIRFQERVYPLPGADCERTNREFGKPLYRNCPSSGSGWREIDTQRSNHRSKKRCCGRGPGVKCHRIPRRVPDDGRCPGFSRSGDFHELSRTRILALIVIFSRFEKSPTGDPLELVARRCDTRECTVRATGVSEARLSPAPWEENAHALGRLSAVHEATARNVAIRRSGLECRETLDSPGQLRKAADFTQRPSRENGSSEPGTREVRVHAVR